MPVQKLKLESKNLTYLHKDFYGGLSLAFEFIEKELGYDALEEYWRRVARTCYRPLIEKLRKEGLPALEEYLRGVFEPQASRGPGQNGTGEPDFEITRTGDELILKINRCPALSHMREAGYPIHYRYCEHTRVVNETICKEAGYEATCEYDQDAARCVQRFKVSK
ncbi:MAG TPA: hypothetical protein GXX51_08485 [Firmicutes bacterium]|nr:hypothetical protein [Bacillota bacterium]